MIEEYKLVKQLGKGSYGEVLLVEDSQQHKLALKKVSKEKGTLFHEYQTLQAIDSINVVKVHRYFEDEAYSYLLMEYCEGGDLHDFQLQQKEKVFSIKQATKILADVIRGLEEIHRKGYVHRDIKLTNIMIRRDSGQEKYVLGDFGFAKKSEELDRTFAGTNRYMSPEVLCGEDYSFGVDMWSFGVLLYFMLHKKHPFVISTQMIPDQRGQALKNASKQFNYRKSVEELSNQGVKKIRQELHLQDLFQKIFEEDIQKRINFSQIREHPLFQKYFPQGASKSSIIYQKSYLSIPADSRKMIDRKELHLLEIYRGQAKKASFLSLVNEEFKDNILLSPQQCLSFRFLVMKYNIMILKSVQEEISHHLKIMMQIKKEISKSIEKAEIQFVQMHKLCNNILPKIVKINKFFPGVFESQIKSKSFSGNFKASYREATSKAYSRLIKHNPQQPQKKKFSLYYACLVSICHGFNQIKQFKQEQLFEFFYQKKEKRIFDFGILQNYLKEQGKETIFKNIIKKVIKQCF